MLRNLSVPSFAALAVSIPCNPASAGEKPSQAEPQSAAAERGYDALRHKTFLPADFDQQVFEELWKVWPEPLRSQAREASPQERRRMAFARYGLIEPPEAEEGYDGPALGYVDDGKNGWVMNCLACHGGKVAGRVIPGLPNTHFALETLTEEVRLTKLRLGKRLTHMDLGSLAMPLGTTRGTTNAVVFGVALGALRDRDMNVTAKRGVPNFVHHDMDAPPLWNVRKKTSLYCDGFSPINSRVLMQFVLIPANGPDVLKEWEDEFQDILAWIRSLEPPKYPWEIDRELADRGRIVFEATCSRCHGTYGPEGEYEQQIIPLEEVGTDPIRLHALTPEHRRRMRQSWMSHYGEDPVIIDPGGYIAPPLDGIWATAPYFHNGSVPTLWHVLHPDARPVVWRRTSDGYDQGRAGLEITTFDSVPSDVRRAAERREYFDTTQHGKSAAGHRFPDVLTEEEKRAVLEYLKTL